MFYSKNDGQYIQEGNPFTIDGVQYPANFLNLSTPEQKEAIGLEEVIATNSPANDQYYWVSTELNEASLTYVNTPKDLDTVKSNSVAQINQTAYSILLPSDWMVVKSVETNTPMSTEWNTWRQSIRTTADTSRLAVVEATDVDEVQAIMGNITWSPDPNQPIQE
jgi:hypothetical protein